LHLQAHPALFSLEGGNVSGKELTHAFVLPEIMGYNGGGAKIKK
jgi:hypothetical protein